MLECFSRVLDATLFTSSTHSQDAFDATLFTSSTHSQDAFNATLFTSSTHFQDARAGKAMVIQSVVSVLWSKCIYRIDSKPGKKEIILLGSLTHKNFKKQSSSSQDVIGSKKGAREEHAGKTQAK